MRSGVGSELDDGSGHIAYLIGGHRPFRRRELDRLARLRSKFAHDLFTIGGAPPGDLGEDFLERGLSRCRRYGPGLPLSVFRACSPEFHSFAVHNKSWLL